MIHKSMRNLELDKRLVRRSGWLPEEDLQRKLEELPDVSDKATTTAEEEEAAEGGAPEGETPA